MRTHIQVFSDVDSFTRWTRCSISSKFMTGGVTRGFEKAVKPSVNPVKLIVRSTGVR